jgi:hypothetical protein
VRYGMGGKPASSEGRNDGPLEGFLLPCGYPPFLMGRWM